MSKQENISYENNKIVKFNSQKKVKKLGNGGYVLIPRELIGKIVEINYNKL